MKKLYARNKFAQFTTDGIYVDSEQSQVLQDRSPFDMSELPYQVQQATECSCGRAHNSVERSGFIVTASQ